MNRTIGLRRSLWATVAFAEVGALLLLALLIAFQLTGLREQNRTAQLNRPSAV